MRVHIDPERPDEATIARAAEVIRQGGLVAFPTETVYGLGANALVPAAVDRIYAAKGRPSYNPIIVHVASAEQARDVAREWPDAAARLAAAFWPGPLTLVLPRRAEVPLAVTAGLDTVGVRMPAHPVARALLHAAGVPIAAPSANRSGEVSPTTGAHVEKSLGEAVDLVLDAGPTTVGIESTVLDLTATPPAVLRPGAVSVADVSRVLGRVVEGPAAAGTEARRSPGMLDRHYAPRAPLVLVDAADLAPRITEGRRDGRRIGAISRGTTSASERGTMIVVLPSDARGYAARLYSALHELDDAGVELIVVEAPPEAPEWAAVRDRLRRASHR